MKTKELAEIISNGKQLAYSLYEARNQAITSDEQEVDDVLSDELLAAHDEMVRRFSEMERLIYPVNAAKSPVSVTAESQLTTSESQAVTVKPKVADRIESALPKSWSQTDLAKEAGLSPMTIQNVMHGKGTPRRSTLAKIEQALGLEVGALDE